MFRLQLLDAKNFNYISRLLQEMKMQLQLSFLLHFVMLLFSAMVHYCGLMMVLCIFAKGAIKEALKRLSLIFGVLEHSYYRRHTSPSGSRLSVRNLSTGYWNTALLLKTRAWSLLQVWTLKPSEGQCTKPFHSESKHLWTFPWALTNSLMFLVKLVKYFMRLSWSEWKHCRKSKTLVYVMVLVSAAGFPAPCPPTKALIISLWCWNPILENSQSCAGF